MAQAIQPTKQRSRKSIITAVVLQCIPLLGAAGCASEGASNQRGGAPLLWFSVLFWGFGYLYVRRYLRFFVVLMIGPLFAFSSCSASFKGVTYDYEHSYIHNNEHDIATANRASYQEALIISGAVLLLSVDVWRLTALYNAQLDRRPDPPLPEPEEEEGDRPEVPGIE